MRLEELRRHPAFNATLLFALAWLTGWSVFDLQAISLVKLLEGIGIDFLPSLMLLQAGCSWGLLRLWGRSANSSSRSFFVSALAAGALVAVFSHGSTLETLSQLSHPWIVYGSMFIMSQLVINALRMGIHVTFSRRISVLNNPQISIQLAIAEEAGGLVAALLLMFMPHPEGLMRPLLMSLPFLGGFAVYAILGAERKRKLIPANLLRPEDTQTKRMPAFFSWLIALFAMVASLKSLQWYGMAYGLHEASQQGLRVLVLFSRQSLVQSIATLSILVASLSFASRIPSWSWGFRVLLAAQTAGAAVLAIFPTPYAFMGTEVLRKVLERGFLSRSLQLLTSTLPEEQRFESRHFMERWSTTSGTAMAGLLAFVTTQGYLPMPLLWTAMAGMGLLGLFLRRRLFDTLNDFHVARLRQVSLDGVLQACHVLGNPECRHHHAALTNLLDRNPRPSVKKAILRALGRMQHAPVVEKLLCHLHADREDIQLAAVQSVNFYRGHEINFRLLNELRESVRSQLPMRLSVIRCITERLDRLVVPYLVEVLEGQPGDRVAANAVEILGEIAHSEKDEELMGYIAKFLDARYPRRVRANAAAALYRHPLHRGKALEVFDLFLTSMEQKELDSCVYMIGVLGLRGHESFVWERSVSQDHSNITCLVALLRLGNPHAAELLAGWIAGTSDEKARESLVRLSVLPPRRRARVFYEVLEHHPGALNLVFDRMRKSQRDFDVDRDLIREEAQRLQLRLTEEDAWDLQKKEAA